MLESLTGFVVVGLAIAIGYVIGRIDLLGEHARPVLARLTFFVLSPFLLFVVLAEADVRTLFSALLPVSAIAAVAVIAIYVLDLAVRLAPLHGRGHDRRPVGGSGQLEQHRHSALAVSARQRGLSGPRDPAAAPGLHARSR